MAVITKETAKQVAKTLTAKKAEEIKKLKVAFEKCVFVAYNRTVPASIKKACKATPGYFKQLSHLKLDGNGWRWHYVSLPEKVIVRPSSEYWTPEGEDNKKLTQLFIAIEDKEEALAKLTLDIEKTLLSLKTYKRIEEQFNEAFLLLPQITITAVSINMNGLRQRLAS